MGPSICLDRVRIIPSRLSLIIFRVKKPWVSAGFAVAALAAFVPVVFGANLAGVYVIRPLRLLLLPVGIALAAGSLESVGLIHLRSHLLEHRQAYLRVVRVLALVATAALVLVGYVWFTTLGTWTRWPSTTDYYDRLSSALASGRLYVKETPDPRLLALPNPYDPDARKGISGLVAGTPGSIWDMSVYRGRVYPYWGPAPALLLIPLKLVFSGVFGDQLLTFAFLAGAFFFESLILIRLWQRFFPAIPIWTLIAAMLLIGFVNPVPWLLFSPRIYEAAIAAAQFFLLGGLYFAFLGLDREPASNWMLAVAALFWVGAVGSRATLAIAVAFLAVMVIAWLLWSRRGQWSLKAFIPKIIWFALPLLLGAMLVMWYNLARFGSVFEFGFRYAITMLDQNKYRSILFSPQYIVPNAYLYLLNPPALSSQFPFVKPVWNGDHVASFNARTHSIYNAERIVGLLYVAPFFLLGLLAPAAALVGRRGRSAAKSSPPAASSDTYLRWFILVLSGLALVQLLVVFLVFYSTMRYFEDAAPTLALLSILGFWLLYERLASRRIWRALYASAAMALLFFTIAMGILTGFSSDVARLKAVNPALLTHLKLFFIALARRFGG